MNDISTFGLANRCRCVPLTQEVYRLLHFTTPLTILQLCVTTSALRAAVVFRLIDIVMLYTVDGGCYCRPRLMLLTGASCCTGSTTTAVALLPTERFLRSIIRA